jgi:hypothetical protein
LKNNLGWDHTLHWGESAKISLMTKSAQTTLGGHQKVLNDKSAQTTLGGMKENPQGLEVLKQSRLGMKEFQKDLSMPQKSLI